MKETLGDIGEDEMLNRLKYFLAPNQIDDDTAEINTSFNKQIINTDVLVENVHFSDKTTCPKNIGWKAISTNISDLVSSGSTKVIGVTVGLIAPPETSWEWVENVYEGMNQALSTFGGQILGGDCSRGKERILSITAIGEYESLRLHRSHAMPGDVILSTGPHGLSRLGLALLSSEQLKHSNNLSKRLKAQAIEAHQRPKPAINEIKSLKKCKPDNLPWRAAGTDTSDGLLKAINNICSSSDCQASLKKNNLPKVSEWPSGDPWETWCINGGEDFEVIVCIPLEWANEWIKIQPNVSIIGEIKKGKPNIYWENGLEIYKNIKDIEFKHF